MKKRLWTSIISIGLAGQVAWTVENMYFNVFLYNTISTDPGYIALMVAASAIVATLTTILAGAISDRTGLRKPFIAGGYLVWALTVALFAFVSPSSLGSVKAAALTVVLLDCIMTFFGSTSNDAVFNAYITESVDSDKRTKVEAVVQILPMASMLLVFGVLDGFTQKGQWPLFFLIVAGLMLLAGILSLFLLEGGRKERKEDSSFLDSLLYGFKPSTIRENRKLYVALTAFGINALAMQVFFPYLIIYIQEYLGFQNYVVLLGLVLVVSSVLCVILGRVADSFGRTKASFPAVSVMVMGLILMYGARTFGFTSFAGIVMMTGYLVSTSILSSLVRDYTPEGSEGRVQGVRMIFQVMLPMVLGPYLGAAAIRRSNLTYVDLGVVKTIPSPLVFLIAAGVAFVGILPLIVLKRSQER